MVETPPAIKVMGSLAIVDSNSKRDPPPPPGVLSPGYRLYIHMYVYVLKSASSG